MYEDEVGSTARKQVLSYTGPSGLSQHLHKIVMESIIVYS